MHLLASWPKSRILHPSRAAQLSEDQQAQKIRKVIADVRMLTKQLRAALTPGYNIYNSIAIVIALNSINKDFDTKTSSLLETGDKTINEIQEILCSAEAKNLSKRATDITGDVAMAFRGNQGRDNYSRRRRKAESNKRCYNCNRLGHYGIDCRQPDRRES